MSLMPTTMSLEELATSPPQTLLLLLTSVAKLGKMELALPAHSTGTLMPMVSANPSLTSVRVMNPTDVA
jgi:hypothetical protein